MKRILSLLLLAPTLALAQNAETYTVSVDRDMGAALLWIVSVVVAFALGWFLKQYYTSHNLKGMSGSQIANELLTNSRAADYANQILQDGQLGAFAKYVADQVAKQVNKVNPPQPPAQ